MRDQRSDFMSMLCKSTCCPIKLSCGTQTSIFIAFLVFTMMFHPANVYGRCFSTTIMFIWLFNIVMIDVMSEIISEKPNHKSFLDKIFDMKILKLFMTEIAYMVAVLWLPHMTYVLIFQSIPLNLSIPDASTLIAFAIIFASAAVAIYVKITFAFALPATIMEEREVFGLAKKLSKNFQLQILAVHVITLISLSILWYICKEYITPNVSTDFYSSLAHQALICAVIMAHALFLGTMIAKLYKKAIH